MHKAFTRTAAVVAAAGLMVGLGACASETGGGSASDSESYTLRVSYPSAATMPSFLMLQELSDRLEEKSDGRLKLELYSDSQLGTTSESVQAAENGDEQIAYTDSATLASLVSGEGKYLDIFSGPFLFESIQEGLNFHESPVFREMADAFEAESNLKIVSLNWFEGQRSMIGHSPYIEPSDMENARVRVPPIETWTRTFDLIGAVPTTVEIAEVYSALDQGVVEATENGVSGIQASRYFEAVKHLTLTRHFMPFYGFVMNQGVFDDLPADLGALLLEEFNKAGTEQGLESVERENGIIAELEAEGVTVHEANLAAYKRVTEPFYDGYPAGFVDRIREAARK